MKKLIISFISITYLLFNSSFLLANAPAPKDIGFEECEYGRLLAAEPGWWDVTKRLMKSPSYLPNAIEYAGNKQFLNKRRPINRLIRITIHEGREIRAKYLAEDGENHILINNTHKVIFDKTDERWSKCGPKYWVCSEYAMEPSYCPFELIK